MSKPCIRNILLVFSFILSLSFIFPKPSFASIDDFLRDQLAQKMKLSGEKIRANIFNNSTLTLPTHDFNPNQTIYYKLEISGSGEKQRQLRLLDSNKKEITTRVLNQMGNYPFTYTASLSAPSKEGIYYIDIKIEGEDFSFASQENINVGKNTSTSPKISSKAEAKFVPEKNIPTGAFLRPIPIPTPTPEASWLSKKLPFLSPLTPLFNLLKNIVPDL